MRFPSSKICEKLRWRGIRALKRLLQGQAALVSSHLIRAGPEQIAEARGAVAKQLQEAEPILAGRGQSGKLKIVAARYGLDTGKSTWLAVDPGATG